MKYFYLIAAMCCTLCAQAQNDYELRTLTFEGEEWSSFIDEPQSMGQLLYGESGYGLDTDSYKWSDSKTLLSGGLCGNEDYGWAYWYGGHAISNYGSKNYMVNNNSNVQLTVYNPNGADEITRTGNGHNGSDNFVMHYGYFEAMGMIPELTFTDKVARVIDHMWITNACYPLYCFINGDAMTEKIGENDWVKVIATGYNGAEETGTAEFFLCNGPDNMVKEWTKFDLSSLGAVTKVTFDVTGTSRNEYGFSQPAYFAYDDVAVRFPINTGIENIMIENESNDVYYDLMGRKVNNPGKGIYIHNGKKVFIR